MAWNLIAGFEYYLLAGLGLSLVQLAHHAILYRTILRAPQRWPRLVQILRHNLGLLMTGPVLAAAGTASLLWAAHLTLRRVVVDGAALDATSLGARLEWLVALLLVGGTMVFIDARAVARAARPEPVHHLWLVDLTEAGLRAREASPVRNLVEWYVRFRLLRNLPLVKRWLWHRSLEQGLRLAFGAILWAAWATSR